MLIQVTSGYFRTGRVISYYFCVGQVMSSYVI